MTMPDQIFINIAVLAVGVAIGALLGETSRQQHDRQLFREYINFMTESEHNNELLFREVIQLQTEKGANHEKEFGTYLHVPQMSIGCRCGATISLERGLAPYEFQCSCCEFHAKGKTNIAEQEFTVPCKCGNPITLHWNKDTRRYTE